MPWNEESNPARLSGFQRQEEIWCPGMAGLPNNLQKGAPLGGLSSVASWENFWEPVLLACSVISSNNSLKMCAWVVEMRKKPSKLLCICRTDEESFSSSGETLSMSFIQNILSISMCSYPALYGLINMALPPWSLCQFFPSYCLCTSFILKILAQWWLVKLGFHTEPI